MNRARVSTVRNTSRPSDPLAILIPNSFSTLVTSKSMSSESRSRSPPTSGMVSAMSALSPSFKSLRRIILIRSSVAADAGIAIRLFCFHPTPPSVAYPMHTRANS